jgi:hypothetical protein
LILPIFVLELTVKMVPCSLIFCPYVIVYNSLSPSVIVCLTVRHFVIVFLIVCPSFVVCLRVSPSVTLCLRVRPDRIIANDIWTEDQTENDSRTDIGNVTDEDDTPTDKDGDSYNSLILTCEFFCLFRNNHIMYRT